MSILKNIFIHFFFIFILTVISVKKSLDNSSLTSTKKKKEKRLTSPALKNYYKSEHFIDPLHSVCALVYQLNNYSVVKLDRLKLKLLIFIIGWYA